MPDPRHLLGSAQPSGQRQVVYGQVSQLQPAPNSFTDPLFVVLPDLDLNRTWKVTNWPAIHGATLPTHGAAVLAIFDHRQNLRVTWWDAAYTGPLPGGAAGGVLSGTYPNPGMAAGAAAANLGSAGGVLSGTYPNPGMAAGAAATNVGTLGGDFSGTLPNPALAPPYGFASFTGNQATSNTTINVSTWSGTAGGGASIASGGITVPAGVYAFTANVRCDISSGYRQMVVTLNGTNLSPYSIDTDVAPGTAQIAGMVSAGANQVFTVSLYTNAAGTWYGSAAWPNQLAVWKISH